MSGLRPKEYLERLSLLWGEEALQRTRIYLDTNYWARLRQAEVAPARFRDAACLLDLLRRGVREKNWICVFSGYSLMELLKHAGADEHDARADLVDQLGRGYCVTSPLRLAVNEADYFFRLTFDPASVQDMPARLAWTRPAFLFSDSVPTPLEGAEAVETWSTVRDFLTLMWSWPLRTAIEQFRASPRPFPSHAWTEQAAASVNATVRKGDGELPSARQLYLDELLGLAASNAEFLVDQFSDFMAARRRPVPTPEQREACGVMLATGIRDLARVTSIAHALPSFHIPCKLHTALRRDKRRPHAPNDFMDIEHARAALPHCDYFLTDAHNATLIQSSGLAKDYACKVAGSIESATQLLAAHDKPTPNAG
jgi:hypothetical protein